MIDVSIIIVNYNTEDHLKECLDSILKLNYKVNIEVIVVDNNSSSKEIEKFPQLYPDVRFLFSKENKGFGAGCNMGFSVSSGKYIAFVNPDILFTKNIFDNLYEFISVSNKVGFCGCLFYNQINEIDYTYNYFPGFKWEFVQAFGIDSKRIINYLLNIPEIKNKKSFKVDWIMGAFLMCSRDLFDRLKGFDENIFLYYEDVDIQKRAFDLSYQNICLPLQLNHFGRSSIRSYESENIYYFHMNRSRLIYFYKHFSFFKRNLIRLLHIFGLIMRIIFLIIRKKFAGKKKLKLIQYWFILKIFFGTYKSIINLKYEQLKIKDSVYENLSSDNDDFWDR